MAQINFKPESGADFFGKIEHLYEERLFRASCYAELRKSGLVERESHQFWVCFGKSGLVERESPKFWMCATDEAAEKWIEVQAALRGFSRYTVLREPSDRSAGPSHRRGSAGPDHAATAGEKAFRPTPGSRADRFKK